MLQDDPNDRPSCEKLLEFPLFKKNESKSHSILDIHLKQMSYLKPNVPCSLPSERKISASSSCFNQIKPKRKIEPQRSGICSRRRTSLAFTFLKEDGIAKNNVSDSILS